MGLQRMLELYLTVRRGRRVETDVGLRWTVRLRKWPLLQLVEMFLDFLIKIRLV